MSNKTGYYSKRLRDDHDNDSKTISKRVVALYLVLGGGEEGRAQRLKGGYTRLNCVWTETVVLSRSNVMVDEEIEPLQQKQSHLEESSSMISNASRRCSDGRSNHSTKHSLDEDVSANV